MQVIQNNLIELMRPYRSKIEVKLQQLIGLLGASTPLKEACAYALTNGGKRFRPALVLMIGKAINPDRDVTDAAMAIECFHTASLIADDLPCMDDDDERRDKPSVHKVYGEATALLASYVLISEGFASLTRNVRVLEAQGVADSASLGILALESVSANIGIHGAVGGQYWDLNSERRDLNEVREILRKKTATLFEIAFVLGWLFGGGKPDKISLVKKAAAHFGMAFQIADDLQDIHQDKDSINIALSHGCEKAKHMLNEEVRKFQEVLQKLSMKSEELLGLVELMRGFTC